MRQSHMEILGKYSDLYDKIKSLDPVICKNELVIDVLYRANRLNIISSAAVGEMYVSYRYIHANIDEIRRILLYKLDSKLNEEIKRIHEENLKFGDIK